jgi:thymidylate synthase
MHVIQSPSNNVDAMLKLYDLIRRAPIIEQRGMRVKHVRDVAIVLRADQPVITNFKARKFNLNYAKQEWLWYLRADKFDDSIQEHAKAWEKLKQGDGSFFSNYGQYIFSPPAAEGEDREPSQFDYVIETLLEDPGSRRASMVLLQRNHLFADNKDVVCTYAINFGIDNGYLEMTVMMRSNDVIFGFTNDAFCFWNLYLFVYTVLRKRMPDLKVGSYTHFANSMHAYEKHFGMLNEICVDARNGTGYTPIQLPAPTFEEVVDFLNKRDGDGQLNSYTSWVKTQS